MFIYFFEKLKTFFVSWEKSKSINDSITISILNRASSVQIRALNIIISPVYTPIVSKENPKKKNKSQRTKNPLEWSNFTVNFSTQDFV